ncbi:MAG: hypothetical protein H6744_11970 [Deltaproteobacteria bacterium]|nr:hypothetical protein [Deltaproteobacteria bacterium]MCB9787387.1 hypothetical protein [Deltaproteobacteria bacterium]
MKFPISSTTRLPLGLPLGWLRVVAAISLVGTALSLPAAAQSDTPVQAPPAVPTVGPVTQPAGTGTPVVTTSEATEEEESGLNLPFSASLTWITSVGAGTFVKGVQGNDLVVSSITPSLTVPFKKSGLSLSAGISGTWYQIPDLGTPLAKNTFLWSDLGLTLSHGSIFANKDKGLTLSGSFALIVPASRASRFLTRVVSIRPGLAFQWKVGRLTIGALANFTKHFMRSRSPQIDCDKWPDGSQCPTGRDPADPGFDNGAIADVADLEDLTTLFSGERAPGGRTWIPSAGVTSFAVGYGLTLGLEIVDGLSINGAISMAHAFGIRSYEVDGLSSDNARAGRSQVDALTTSLGISYTLLDHLTVGASLDTSTLRPLGDNGKDIVVVDFERAPDNITTVSFSLTGSL